jgi:hypothetical protein
MAPAVDRKIRRASAHREALDRPRRSGRLVHPINDNRQSRCGGEGTGGRLPATHGFPTKRRVRTRWSIKEPLPRYARDERRGVPTLPADERTVRDRIRRRGEAADVFTARHGAELLLAAARAGASLAGIARLPMGTSFRAGINFRRQSRIVKGPARQASPAVSGEEVLAGGTQCGLRVADRERLSGAGRWKSSGIGKACDHVARRSRSRSRRLDGSSLCRALDQRASCRIECVRLIGDQ